MTLYVLGRTLTYIVLKKQGKIRCVSKLGCGSMYTPRNGFREREGALQNRPFLKWPGGKTRLLSHLLPLFPDTTLFCEPFLGSGAVFLNTQYKSYRLNDRNADLISLYRLLQEKQENFIDEVAGYFQPKYNDEKQFYLLREKFNKSRSLSMRARLFLYLNRHGFNGLCRYNQSGEFNVPFGRYDKPYFPEKELRFFYQKAQHAEFLCEDFETVLQNLKKQAVVYCDPPYVPASASANFTSYTQFGFSIKQQESLAALGRKLAMKGHTVVISNHDNAITQKLYEGAQLLQVSVPRLIGADPTKRKPINELIAVFGQ